MRIPLPSPKRRLPRQSNPGFTLVEILVVITIVLLASLVALPVVYSSLNGRQVTDAARIFSGGLVGARDSAIKYNEPRGIRLLPDPMLTIPAPGVASSGTTQLVYNRYIPIEPAGDYSEGKVTIGPMLPGSLVLAGFPPAYPRATAAGDVYPFPVTSPTAVPGVLMVEESRFAGGFATATGEPNAPTNWYWNVRIGDKIKIGGTGRAYTIVGPCTVSPWGAGGNFGNPELFVNVGAPGTASPLQRQYYSQSTDDPPKFPPLTKDTPEFLFLVNGEDDDADGYVDDGWDGYNQDADVLADGVTPIIDELDEWETEKWLGSIDTSTMKDVGARPASPTPAWIASYYNKGLRDSPYIIKRRPVPSQGAREIMLPAGMVIDATTWNSTQERSRIPVEPGSLYCDVMVSPGGLYVPTTTYSAPTSAVPSPFLHFWITSRDDVYPATTVPFTDTSTYKFHLPMAGNAMALSGTVSVMPAKDGANYPGTSALPTLKGERRLVTMFAQSGLVVTNTIESIPSASPYQTGEGFCVGDLNYPFYKAQNGLREAR